MPGQVLSIVYGVAQFLSFELLTKFTHNYFHKIDYSKIEKKNMFDLKHHTGLGHPEHNPKTYTKLHEPEDKIIEHLLCGSIAGCVGTGMKNYLNVNLTVLLIQFNFAVTSFPLDVVRTRLISQGNPKVYKGVSDAVIKVYKLEGVRGYYKGKMI